MRRHRGAGLHIGDTLGLPSSNGELLHFQQIGVGPILGTMPLTVTVIVLVSGVEKGNCARLRSCSFSDR